MVQYPPVLTVEPTQAVLQFERLSLVEGIDVRFQAEIKVLGMHAFHPAVSQFLFCRPPGEVQPAFIEIGALPAYIRDPNEHGRRIRNGTEACFALPKRSLGLFA